MSAATPARPTAVAAPAPPRQRVLAQARFEASTLLRNGEQLLVALVLPLMALVALRAGDVPSLGEGRRIDLAVPGVLAMCVISAAFTSQAIQTGFDRRYAVLRYLGTTPLGRDGLLWAKALATLVVEAIQLLVIGAVGLALGWKPRLAGLPMTLLLVLLGTWAFVALALLLAGTLRAEATLAVANLIWVVLVGVGGVIVPRAELSPALSGVVQFLPSSALADGLRDALAHGRFDVVPVLVLVAWAAVATAAASRLFRWSD